MKKLILVFILTCLACQMVWGQTNLHWVKGNLGTGNSTTRDILTDAACNVYVFGFFQGTLDFDPNTNTNNIASNGTSDIFIQKLDALGNLVWVKIIGGSGGDFSERMTIDNGGNLYLTGFFQSTVDFDPNSGVSNKTSNGGNDAFLLKMDNNGNFIWVKTFGGLGNDVCREVRLDNSGNIYTVGFFDDVVDFDPESGVFNLNGNGTSGYIQKLDANGNFVWVKKIGGNTGSLAYGRSIEVDASHNVYVGGDFDTSLNIDIGAGTLNLTSNGTADVYVAKFDTNGNCIWLKGAGGTGSDATRDVTVAPSGAVYVIGYYSNTVDFDASASTFNLTSNGSREIFIKKLDNNGNFIWAKSMGGTSSDEGQAITLDDAENIYAVGSFQGTADFDPNAGTSNLTSAGSNDGFIQKMNNAGNLIWVKKIGSTGSDVITKVYLNQPDYMYLAGVFSTTVNFELEGGTPVNLTSNTVNTFAAKYSQNLPSLSFEPTNTILSPFTTTCLASTAQSFQVKGDNLNGNLVVNAPVNYQISLTAGGTYTNSLTLVPACGTVLPTTIFIRLIGGLTVGNYNNFVTLSSVGATSKTLGVLGTVQASSATATIALSSSYCISAPAVPLSATPTGGTFTIDNVAATQFNPSVLGVGNKVVKYNFTDANGCLASSTSNVMVNALPTLSNNVNLSYGTNQTGFSIIGLPVGSTYTMNGTPITEFIPSVWGAGTHTLVQSFTNANGCSNTLSKTITITQPPILSNTTGATCWTGTNINVDANMTVAGATPMTGAIVSFGAGYNSAQDRLIYPIPLFGVTGVFDVNTGVLRLVGNATTAQYQQIFRSIQYQNISANPSYGTTRTINFTAGDVLPLYPCGSADAHFYKFVPAPQITWQNAKIAAENQNYFGLKGYLATISCLAENNFAFNSLGQQGWIGASDDVAFTGSYSPNGEGQWYWVTGPEAGTRFWQGNLGGVPVNGLYNNWAVGEPNNFQNLNESFAHLLSNGQWNDYVFNNSNILGYYIEFGGLSTDPSIQSTTSSKQIQLATKLDFAIASQFCANVPNIALVGTPTGGTFKVNGNIATVFNPSILGVGTYTITYELAGCTIPASKTVTVNPLPTPSITGLQASYCADVTAFALTGLPTGGTFTVNGGVATQFNPSNAGAGVYTVVYSVTNAQGCTKTTSQDVTVTALPTPEIIGLQNSYCISQASLGLVGSPTGGTFQINNQNTNTLDIQALGTGKHTVSYTVVNAQNCSKTTTQEIEIFPLPTLAFVNVPDEYCSQASSFALEATPTGGTFRLNGVPSTTLNPADFAVGDQINVQYDYISPQGCANSLSKTLQIIFSSSFVQADFEEEICPTKDEVLEAISLAEEQDLITINGELQYTWSNGAKTRTIKLENTQGGDYKVLIRSASGCPLRDFSFKVRIKCDTKLFLPDAFTPNGDGKNDLWEIFGGDFIKLDLRVYNCWGELVFVSNSQTQLWDGSVGGKPAPAGVYAWTVSYANPLTPDKKEKAKGRVMLLR